MKKYFLLISFPIVLIIMFSGCKDYLNIPAEASISEEEVFGTYFNFQSYVDQLYNKVCDPISYLTSSPNFGGETVSNVAVTTAFKAINGTYLGFKSFNVSND